MLSNEDWQDWVQAMYEGLVEYGFDSHNCTVNRTSMGASRTFIRALNQYMEHLSMAKNTAKTSPSAKSGNLMPVIVNVSLDAADEDGLKALAQDSATVYTCLSDFLARGYKITFSVTNDGQSVMCSATCRAEGDPNNGKLLSGFSADWYYALVSLIGKHRKVKGVWPTGDQTPRNRPLFG